MENNMRFEAVKDLVSIYLDFKEIQSKLKEQKLLLQKNKPYIFQDEEDYDNEYKDAVLEAKEELNLLFNEIKKLNLSEDTLDDDPLNLSSLDDKLLKEALNQVKFKIKIPDFLEDTEKYLAFLEKARPTILKFFKKLQERK